MQTVKSEKELKAGIDKRTDVVCMPYDYDVPKLSSAISSFKPPNDHGIREAKYIKHPGSSPGIRSVYEDLLNRVIGGGHLYIEVTGSNPGLAVLAETILATAWHKAEARRLSHNPKARELFLTADWGHAAGVGPAQTPVPFIIGATSPNNIKPEGGGNNEALIWSCRWQLSVKPVWEFPNIIYNHLKLTNEEAPCTKSIKEELATTVSVATTLEQFCLPPQFCAPDTLAKKARVVLRKTFLEKIPSDLPNEFRNYYEEKLNIDKELCLAWVKRFLAPAHAVYEQAHESFSDIKVLEDDCWGYPVSFCCTFGLGTITVTPDLKRDYILKLLTSELEPEPEPPAHTIQFLAPLESRTKNKGYTVKINGRQHDLSQSAYYRLLVLFLANETKMPNGIEPNNITINGINIVQDTKTTFSCGSSIGAKTKFLNRLKKLFTEWGLPEHLLNGGTPKSSYIGYRVWLTPGTISFIPPDDLTNVETSFAEVIKSLKK